MDNEPISYLGPNRKSINQIQAIRIILKNIIKTMGRLHDTQRAALTNGVKRMRYMTSLNTDNQPCTRHSCDNIRGRLQVWIDDSKSLRHQIILNLRGVYQRAL